MVLGLLEFLQPATAYDLKQIAGQSTFNIWHVPHTRLYTECARLCEAGLIDEDHEETGRRRRIYRLSEAGRQALEEWRSVPTETAYELRDVATLQLFLGADPQKLAESQIDTHRRRLAEYEELRARIGHTPEGWQLALDHGIGHEREYLRFWTALADGAAPIATSAGDGTGAGDGKDLGDGTGAGDATGVGDAHGRP